MAYNFQGSHQTHLQKFPTTKEFIRGQNSIRPVAQSWTKVPESQLGALTLQRTKAGTLINLRPPLSKFFRGVFETDVDTSRRTHTLLRQVVKELKLPARSQTAGPSSHHHSELGGRTHADHSRRVPRLREKTPSAMRCCTELSVKLRSSLSRRDAPGSEGGPLAWWGPPPHSRALTQRETDVCQQSDRIC